MSDLRSLLPDMPALFIGGKWIPGRDDANFSVFDPADESVIATVAGGTPQDALRALDAAVQAQESWAGMPPRERGEILRRACSMLLEQIDSFAELISLEMGKPLAEARGEVLYGADFFRWFAEESTRIRGDWLAAPDGSSRFLTIRKPVGPCLLVTPWNFPLAMVARKVAPAIAAGCTMILKPAESTPLSSLAIARILSEAGLPAGVLNVVTTMDPSALSLALMNDARLRKVSFTGSTRVGKLLVAQSAGHVQRLSLELGGNAPFIVFGDANVDAAVDGAVVAKTRNTGESCVAANRFLIHESLAEEFTAKLAERMGALNVGRGQRPGVQVGPLISAQAVATVSALVAEAVADGARVVLGGGPVDGPGYFFRPTVLADVAQESIICNSEIFGPVAVVTTFASEEEAVSCANRTEYGLASYVYTNETARMIRLCERLDFGMVGVNTGFISHAAAPFGGIKASGYGREGGFLGIDEYLEATYVNLPIG